jgi:hypothetical protein
MLSRHFISLLRFALLAVSQALAETKPSRQILGDVKIFVRHVV